MNSKLVFYFSSMNSGKSLALLTKDYMLREKGKNTLLLKPSIDIRSKNISSRLGIEKECITVSPDENLYQMLQSYSDTFYEESKDVLDCILVDEAQFLTKEQVWQLSDVVDKGNIDVLCYGIKLNWQGNFFEGSEELMKLSDELVQMDSLCSKYSTPAMFHTKHMGSTVSEIETGYENMYGTVSRKAWKEWRKERTQDNE